MQNNKVMEIKYECKNCRTEWEIQYPKGIDIQEGSSTIYIKYGETIHCPHCDSRRLFIIDRRAI